MRERCGGGCVPLHHLLLMFATVGTAAGRNFWSWCIDMHRGTVAGPALLTCRSPPCLPSRPGVAHV